MNENLRHVLEEDLASLEHVQWSSWFDYMVDAWSLRNVVKWMKKSTTPYSELTEQEKESDREWARKVIDVVERVLQIKISEGNN